MKPRPRRNISFLIVATLLLLVIGFGVAQELNLYTNLRICATQNGWTLTFRQQNLFDDDSQFHISQASEKSPTQWSPPRNYRGEFNASVLVGSQLTIFQSEGASLYENGDWIGNLALHLPWSPLGSRSFDHGVTLIGTHEKELKAAIYEKGHSYPITIPFSTKSQHPLGPMRLAKIGQTPWVFWGMRKSSSPLATHLFASKILRITTPFDPIFSVGWPATVFPDFHFLALSPPISLRVPHPFKNMSVLSPTSPNRPHNSNCWIFLHSPSSPQSSNTLSVTAFDGLTMGRPSVEIPLPKHTALAQEVLSIEAFQSNSELCLLLGGIGGINMISTQKVLRGEWLDHGKILGTTQTRESGIYLLMIALLVLSLAILFRGIRLMRFQR